MLSFGFTESFLASHGCAVGHREKTFGLAEPTYKKIAAVAHSIPICALCTDDGLLGSCPRRARGDDSLMMSRRWSVLP